MQQILLYVDDSHSFQKPNKVPGKMSYKRLDTKQASTESPPSYAPVPSALPTPPPATSTSPGGGTPVVLYTDTNNSHECYDGRTSVVLGSLQVVAGVLSVLLTVILLILTLPDRSVPPSTMDWSMPPSTWCGLPVSQRSTASSSKRVSNHHQNKTCLSTPANLLAIF